MMKKHRIRDLRAMFGAVTWTLLLSGCDRTDAEVGSVNSDSVAIAIDSLTPITTTIVTVEMTGLLLMVPPNQLGGETNVYLPQIISPGVPRHVAWLGFGVYGTEPFVADLCEKDSTYGRPAIRAGICYVNLDKWELQPFGSGGHLPTPATTLPPGLLNVTLMAGTGYKVYTGEGNRIRSHIVFLSGVAGDTCGLAKWKYEPVGPDGTLQAQQERSLTNVLRWEMRFSNPPTLVFRSRGTGSSTSKSVPLPAGGTVHILLAHIPRSERRHLPPKKPGHPGNPPGRVHHFHAYYDLLRDSTGTVISQGHPRRRLPHSASELRGAPCEVRITTPKKAPFFEQSAVGTYACVMASGS
jgi:hypothetical protein